MFQGLSAILYKELIHLRRDPFTLFIMFLIPTLQLTIFGYALNTDVMNVPTVVYDLVMDHSSRELINAFKNTRYFRIVGYVHSDEELHAAIISGRARVGIKIPPEFSANLLRQQRPAQVLVLIDGSDSTTAMRMLNISNAIGLSRAIRLVQQRLGSHPATLEVRPRMLFNPNLRSANFYVPGLVGIIMQVVTIFLTAFAVVREREHGTLEQLLVTPIAGSAIMLGKLIPYALIGGAETTLVLLIMCYVFHVPIHGSPLLLAVLSLSFLFTSLAIGLLLSTFAQNQIQAGQLAFLIMMPSVLLSGFMFPRESMPTPIFLIGYMIPVTYYIEILRGIIIRGAEFSSLWDETLVLTCFGSALIILSALRFRKKLS